MTVYRYLAYDLRTGTALEELPLVDVSFGAVLNEAGPFQAKLPLNARAQSAPGTYVSKANDYLNASQPARTVIYVERDGVLVDGYIIWTRRYQSQDQTISLAGNNIFSYFQARNIAATTTFTGADQATIAATLINNAQSIAGGNINVAVNTTATGVTLSRAFAASDGKPVAEAIQELAKAANGFDFGINVAYSAGVPTSTFTTYYPQRGRSATASGLVFEMGRNMLSYEFPEDGATCANRYLAVGAGDGASMLYTVQSRTDAIDAGYPVLDGFGSFKDIQSSTLLAQIASSQVSVLAYPKAIPEVTVTNAGDSTLGSWQLGDYATFVFGGNPNLPDPRFPTRTALIYRIVAYTATPGNEGQEIIKLTLN